MPKPVLIIQAAADDGPAYFGQWLAEPGIPTPVCTVFTGAAIPERIDDYAGLALLGGYMSANDPLPWIEAVLAFIQQAIAARVPVIGHCLGGQLLARAAGGRVQDNPVPEIGWGPILPAPNQADAFLNWFGLTSAVPVFQWHFQTFTLPDHGQWLAQGPHCRHQAFVLDGIHLGMQFHCEVDAEKIRSWLATSAEELTEAQASPAVQLASVIEASLAADVQVSQRLADHIYSRWAKGLR